FRIEDRVRHQPSSSPIRSPEDLAPERDRSGEVEDLSLQTGRCREQLRGAAAVGDEVEMREWFVGTGLLTGITWILVYSAGLSTWWAAGIAFTVGFTFRVAALYRGWEEPLAREPKGAYKHSDGRPLLGR